MPLDKKAIETLSVNAVKNSIVTSEFLDQFIADNDKEPSWDGFVYIYEDKSKKKSKLKGRMPVQVKGTECDDHSKETISFSMKTVDLKNYLYDGGCILFVVYIGNCGQTNKIYYAELPPIKLRQLLREANEQDNKTVRLIKFPCDNDKKATIFLNCLQNCQKQASVKDEKLLSLEELEKQGILENIVIPFSGVGYSDPQTAIINNEVYLYAKLKGIFLLHPLDIIPKNIHTQQVINASITIGDKLFYTDYQIIKSAKETMAYIGQSFKMRFVENKCFSKINYKNSRKIRVLAKDLDFMLNALDKGYFKINDLKIPLNFNEMDSSNFDIEKERKHLIFAKNVVRVLDILGCSEDINIDDLNDESWRNLNLLIKAFLEKKTVKGLRENLPHIISFNIGKLRFALYMEPCEEKGSYKIYDFFKTDIPVIYKDRNNAEKMIPISQYIILTENDFLSLNNIDFEVLLPSFKKTEQPYETLARENEFLLELLKACDKAEGTRKEKILKTCKDLSNWIFEYSKNELDYRVKILNKFQTIKRWRDFNEEEIKILYKIVENKDTPEDEDYIVGAYLLLGQQQAAEIHFKRLSKEEQKRFKEYPIYHFWKKEKKENG